MAIFSHFNNITGLFRTDIQTEGQTDIQTYYDGIHSELAA